MHAAGIPFVAGTDDIGGFTLHRELEVYVEAGISPAEAVQIATRNGAKYTNLSDLVGSVTVGKVADLILVDGDPTRDISALRNVSLVMTGAATYYPSEIYEALGIAPFRQPPRVTVKAAPDTRK
jgi:imidazolonepropionase-like amidohydrolase